MASAIAPLTDTQCRTAKPSAAGKVRKLFDGGGLFLHVAPTGAKHWRLKYRFAGKEKLLALGSYPEVTLLQAREARQAAKRSLRDNADPNTQRRIGRLTAGDASRNTLRVITHEWLDKHEPNWAKTNSSKIRLRLENEILPWLGDLPIGSITAPMILKRLQVVAQRGARDTARRIRQYMNRIFAYAIQTARAERNPASDLVGSTAAPIPGHYASIENPEELGNLLVDIEHYSGSLITRTAFALAPMLFVRPGELRGMEWSELDFERNEWRIPPLRQKLHQAKKLAGRGPDFIVPLPTQAVNLLRELQPLTGGPRRKFVFPSERDRNRSMSDGTINTALRRLGWSGDKITSHGFRHTASTMLNESRKWSADAIEAQLSHKDPNPIRGIYNNAKYLNERTQMMQSWADHLDELRAKAKEKTRKSIGAAS